MGVLFNIIYKNIRYIEMLIITTLYDCCQNQDRFPPKTHIGRSLFLVPLIFIRRSGIDTRALWAKEGIETEALPRHTSLTK